MKKEVEAPKIDEFRDLMVKGRWLANDVRATKILDTEGAQWVNSDEDKSVILWFQQQMKPKIDDKARNTVNNFLPVLKRNINIKEHFYMFSYLIY